MGGIEDIHQLTDRNVQLQQHKVYDLESLKRQVEGVGFEVLEKGSFFIKPFTHAQMGKMIKLGIIDDFVLEGVWGLAQELPQYGSEIFVNMRKKKTNDGLP